MSFHRAAGRLRADVFSTTAFHALGAPLYRTYVSEFVKCLPVTLVQRNLVAVDREMGKYAKAFTYRGQSIRFDCEFCDTVVQDGSFAFGIAREVFIRDCYFALHRPELYSTLETVIDLGANRGGFTMLAATQAREVVSVEAQDQFHPAIYHNLAINEFGNVTVICGLVGGSGSLSSGGFQNVSMGDLLAKIDGGRADFVKIDIEGSEFPLFDAPEWLRAVGALSMELHPEYGDPRNIIETVVRFGFGVRMADAELRPTSIIDKACFLYADRA